MEEQLKPGGASGGVVALISLVAIIVTIAMGSQFLPWVRTGRLTIVPLQFHVVVGLLRCYPAFVIVVSCASIGSYRVRRFWFQFRERVRQVVLGLLFSGDCRCDQMALVK